MRQALHRGADARGVHEGEHRLQALVRLADQPGLGAVEVQHAGGRGVDAHLVFDARAGHAVALAQAAVVVGQNLRHDEQRDAARALRRIRQAREHDVDDVLGEVVLTGGNEDLAAVQRVGAVAVVLGASLDLAQVRAALRFGEAHRAGPAAFGHRRHVQRHLLLAAVLHDGVHRTHRQARIHQEGPVGRGHHLGLQQPQAHRQTLPTEFLWVRKPLPAAFHKLLIRLLVALGRAHFAIVVGAALFVATAVER